MGVPLVVWVWWCLVPSLWSERFRKVYRLRKRQGGSALLCLESIIRHTTSVEMALLFDVTHHNQRLRPCISRSNAHHAMPSPAWANPDSGSQGAASLSLVWETDNGEGCGDVMRSCS
ncbi:hypothetical protein B0T18DRAFT_410849, partial [Schizothecium vesticola]